MGVFGKFFRKLFIDGAYGVAIRRNGSQGPFVTKYPTIRNWYADPFVCSEDGKDYLFVELMDYRVIYGQIAVAPVENDKIGKFKLVISEPFHMSFPNIFKWNDSWYMIPETYQSNQMRLYKCDDFPYKWHFEKAILENVQLVDHAIYQDGDRLIIISYDIADLEHKYARVFIVNMKSLTAKEVFPKGNICQERAAGTVYEKNGKKYRAIQDCTECYGDFLKIYEIDIISENRIEERKIQEIHAQNLRLDKNRGIQRTHTYNCNGKYETIDFWYPKFYPNKFDLRLWKKVIRKNRAHK